MKSFAVVLFLGVSVTLAAATNLQGFIEANNLVFTPALYREVAKRTEGNFIVSPFSVQTVLAFAQSGCKNATAQEIREALRFPSNNKQIEDSIKTILDYLKDNDFYTFRTSNKMYVKNDFRLKEDFKKVANEVYQAESENIDFTKKVEAAKIINEWIKKKTENKIKNLINPDLLSELTNIVLINTLYFKANWSSPFSLASTKKIKFWKNFDFSLVDMMFQYHSYFNYYRSLHRFNAEFIELPFKGKQATLTIILPERSRLTPLENQLENVFKPHNLTRQLVNVGVPKFKIETETNIKEALFNMQVRKAFDPKQADLSGISGEKGDLYITDAKQKSFIDVNEEGVEAAAATFTDIAMPSALPLQPWEFVADHPFIFYIKVKDIIVLAGRVVDLEE